MEEFGADDDLNPANIPYAAAYTEITSITCSISADEEHTQCMAGFDAASSERIHQFDDESESDEVMEIPSKHGRGQECIKESLHGCSFQANLLPVLHVYIDSNFTGLL